MANYLLLIANGKNILEKRNLQYDTTTLVIANIIKLVAITLTGLIAFALKTEYEIWGLLLILFIHAFYPFKNEINFLGKKIKVSKPINNLLFLTGFIIFAIVNYIEYWNIFTPGYIIAFTLFTFFPALIMILHNGQKGPALKYFFYIYYPAQFAILILTKSIIA